MSLAECIIIGLLVCSIISNLIVLYKTREVKNYG